MKFNVLLDVNERLMTGLLALAGVFLLLNGGANLEQVDFLLIGVLAGQTFQHTCTKPAV